MTFILMKRASLALLLVVVYQNGAKAGEQRKVEVDFYGHTITFEYDNQINSIRYENAVEQFIKRFDEEGAGTDHVPLINRLHEVVNDFGLDDVGKILLIDALTEKAFAHRPQNFKTLFKWYVLYRDSMDVMLCYSNKSITLYGRLNIAPYGIPYLMKDGKTYTDLSFTTSPPTITSVSLYSPRRTMSTTRQFNFDKYRYPRVNALKTIKNFSFEYANKKYSFSATLNQSLINYMRDIPVMELGNMYVSYGFSEAVKTTLISELRKTISPMKQREALGFLLKFVQTLPYKADGDYLGEERYSFGEETLGSDYSDCEDKVILYASLVKELMGIKSVALMYEKDEHVAIGLQLPGEPSDYSFTYNNQKFVAAEPSGTGFELGNVGFELKRVTKAVELY